MNVRKFALVAAWLACAAPALAAPPVVAPVKDKEVWVTIGSDALQTVRSSFKRQGLTLDTPVLDKGGVSAVRMLESQVLPLAGVMHNELNRCAGFVVHEKQDEALLAVAQANAAPKSTLAVSYTLNNSPSATVLMNGVTELNIRNTVNSLSTQWTNRYYNVQSGADASTWLLNQWTSLVAGRTDITVQQFAHTWKQPSVIATIQGTTLPNEVVVLGGHLDSINSSNPTTGTAPGADDDASGVATITEVLRLAVANGYKPARTVKFMAYAGEEVGLYGSKAIANSFQAAGTNVVGVFQLDMVTYKGSPNTDFGMVTDYTNAAQNAFVVNLVSTYLPGYTTTNFACGYACSDHASWTNAGYASSIPFEATINTDNPNIHTANDTLSVTSGNVNNAVKFGKLAAAYMAELAKGATTGNTPPPTGGGTGGTVATATYDATYKAPRCSAAGAGCDSGTLLNGRGTVGPETNKPNTLASACADGTAGTYHSDESNDRLKVATADGSNLAAGKSVTVSATVYSYSTTADKLDLYYSATATSPTWTLIGTYSPSSTGASTITATYTLPSGTTQALRAHFRYNGTAASCGTGTYDDHDDLVFAVQ